MKTFILGVFLAVGAIALQSCSCGAKPCTTGQAGCACRDGNQCDDGAVCGSGNLCQAPTLVGLQVSDGAARGCEVVLTEQPGTAIAFGKFSGGVVGTSIRQAPRVALTFVAPKDAAFPGDGVQLALSSGQLSGVTVTKSSCVDAKGAKLPGASVTLR